MLRSGPGFVFSRQVLCQGDQAQLCFLLVSTSLYLGYSETKSLEFEAVNYFDANFFKKDIYLIYIPTL